MKSIVPAALVVVLEAGFLFSIAALPSRPEPIQVMVQVASEQAAAAPAAQPASPPAATATQSRWPSRS